METTASHGHSDDETPSVAADPKGGEIVAPESSVGDGADASDDKSSRDALANGISSLLSSVINEFDSKAQDTLRSQDQLSSSVDRLTQQLDQLLEDAPSPFIMQHAARISNVRKKVSSLNAVLRSIQRRVDNIDRMLFASLPHKKSTVEGAVES